jgi:hypothetical protein
MDSKFYVSLEAARLLKEKGYNEETDYVIDDEVKELMRSWRTNEAIPEEFADYFFSCPTKSEAIDWLDSKGIMIEISIDIDECAWIFNIVYKEKFITIGHPKDGDYYIDRLEAEEAAIIKALELL